MREVVEIAEIDEVDEVEELAKKVAYKYGTKNLSEVDPGICEYGYTDESIYVFYSQKYVHVTIFINYQDELLLSRYCGGDAMFDYKYCKKAIYYMKELLTGLAVFHDDFFYITSESE
ncbi:MAG: hypothetical protein ACXADW_24780 [Candidatus Hodarchaeales archaeon]|jgi:hypothetical protein